MSEETHDIFSAFHRMAPYLASFFDEDISIVLTDKEKFLLFLLNPNIPSPAKAGDPIQKGTAIYEALHQRKVVSMKIAREILGFPAKGIGIPLKDEGGNVVGGIGICRSLKKQDEIYAISQSISLALHQISIGINTLTVGVQDTVTKSKDILENTSSTASLKQVAETIKQIQSLVKEVSSDITDENSTFQEQAAALQQITASIEEIEATATNLEMISQYF
ncbi:Putative sensory transducer protein YfmS [Sporomusa silvacetica DSM 10669]|uniref:Sensory transducer protein YfmS n=1 Tax=Sporomusa silvacetica DSM 10669 TaxID=1123289 RepID=A0ABZ3ITD8_9FIRM|nr:hypothetical protein [Sporomusa silvacetica]OZC23859.1 putative sensory transducer protein YfmS [Sporomusa silvacetica DSM 10669]